MTIFTSMNVNFKNINAVIQFKETCLKLVFRFVLMRLILEVGRFFLFNTQVMCLDFSIIVK
jgi:hypothetical protein